MSRLPVLLVILLLSVLAGPAGADFLKPHKDRLFAYPAILEERDGGAYRVVDYREMRDINARDEIPQRRVYSDYVSLGVRGVQAERTLQGAGGGLRHFAVGRAEGARVIVLYLHGQGGSRKQGVDDYTFGGNFNRVKNLMAANGGLYLVPDVADFAEAGVAAIAALVRHYRARSPGAPVFVACGSMGGAICWGLAGSRQHATDIDGLILLGSFWHDGFLRSPGFERRIPVFIGHGSGDRVFPVERQTAFYRSILARAPDYPVRFVRFETGSHGTPIRMVDWRETLNWMLWARRAG